MRGLEELLLINETKDAQHIDISQYKENLSVSINIDAYLIVYLFLLH